MGAELLVVLELVATLAGIARVVCVLDVEVAATAPNACEHLAAHSARDGNAALTGTVLVKQPNALECHVALVALDYFAVRLHVI